MKARKISFFYLTGLFFVLIEIAFNIYGKSICTTEGCKVVESFVRGGNINLLILGLVLFSFLFFISLYKFSAAFSKIIEYIHSGVLIIALSVEGYLLGFQSFVLKEFCIFCLVVFGILFLSSIYRVFEKRYEIALAFAGFSSIFLITYLVNPGISQIPPNTLVYSKNCPHCEEIIQFCKTNSININTIEAKDISGTLKSLKIESVPILFSDEGDTKKIIIGKERIKEHLLNKSLSNNKNQQGICPIFETKTCQ
ncbi:MAG: vitamin K epoxide reductase family protein [Thermodesulfovibrio sp.]|nr:vitamin K epoxide reductase family protein [Thermodesulfovibrio sp.]MCX7724168.1 vitamin K epoxide reductase family protein [Thermodesulfovibrio sp.]MDW7971842.1 vitamin K epoxide reductase family protein [Thermodesulfovibrio sp.]